MGRYNLEGLACAHLISILDFLCEDTMFITKTVAIGRHPKCCHRVQETSCIEISPCTSVNHVSVYVWCVSVCVPVYVYVWCVSVCVCAVCACVCI